MADALKTYVIKITAEAKQAQQEIDKLAKSFSEIGIKGKFDLDLDKQTEHLTGAIGRVTDAINELKKEFKEGISTRNISDEIKTMSTQMTQAVEQMTTSFTGFSKTFEGLAGEGGFGLSQVFSDFSKEMKEMMSSYKETMEMINKIVNTTLPKDGSSIDVSDQLANIGKNIKGQIEVTEKEIEDAKNKLDDIFKNFVQDIDAMRNASLGNLRTNSKGKLEAFTSTDVRDYETSITEFLNEVNRVRNKYKTAFDMNNFFAQTIGISEYQMKEIQKGLREQIVSIEKAEREELLRLKAKQDKQLLQQQKDEGEDLEIEQERDIYIKAKIGIDPDSISDDEINKMVDTITAAIDEKIQKRIKPIRIPITFENAIADENDKTIDKDIKTVQGEKGLIKSLKLKVEANKQDLYDTINDTIKDMGDNIPKIPVKIVVDDMDERSIQNAVNDVSNAINKRNADYGKEGFVLGGNGGTININAGDLAKDQTLQEIKGILSSFSIDGIRLSNGKPGQGETSNAPTLPPSYDAGDILDQEYGRMLRFRGRKGQLTQHEKDVLSYTESTVADYEFERKRLEQLGEFRKIVSNTKKSVDDVKELDFYNKSYTDENGIERAFYGNGEQLDVWRKKIENYYRLYANKMKETLDAPTVLDEEGKVVSEGIRTRFNRIKASDETVDYEGREIKEWQKVIIEDNERRRQADLSEKGKREKVQNDSKEQIKLLKGSGLTTEQAIDRIINEKWNEANEKIIKTGTMDKDLKKRYGQIQSRAIAAARNEILRDKDLLPDDKSGLAYDYTLDSIEKQVGRRISSMKSNLKLSGIDTDKKTGDIVASTIAALNEEQGPKAITSAINKIIEEQKPKLAAFEDVARERKKELDSLTDFISLYEKQQRGEQLSDTEDIQMKSLIQDLSTDAARYSAQGSEKVRLDAAKKIIEQYEVDEQKAIKENKQMDAGRTDAYMKAMIEYNKVHEASIEEIYGYATSHKDVVAGKYGKDLQAISKLKSKTKQAAEQIASGKEYLGHAIVRKNETPEEYEKRYDEREDRLRQIDSRINELEALVDHRDVEINGKMQRKSSYSALTKPEQKELDNLKKERNRLWQTQTLSREIMGRGYSWSEEEANKPKEKSIKKGGKLTNLHMSDKVAEEYSKIPFKTDITEIAQMTSEQLTAAAAILDEGATEIEQYLSDVKSKDVDEQARLLIARDVDKLKTQDAELNKEYQKALKEGKTPDDKGVRDIVKQRESIQQSLIELASTDDDNEKVADAIAKLKVKEKILDGQIKEATSSHEVSQKDIDSLAAQKKQASKEQENIRKKGLVVTDENGKQKTYKSSSTGLERTVQEKIRDYAEQRMKEIQESFDKAGVGTIEEVVGSYDVNKETIERNNAEIEKLSGKNDDSSKATIASLKRQNEIIETFISQWVETGQEYITLQEMREDANAKLLTMSMDEQEGKRTPATTTGKARLAKYKKNIQKDIQDSEKNASDMRDRANFLREQAAVRKQEEEASKQRAEQAEQQRKENEAFAKLSMKGKRESIESDYSAQMELLKQRKEVANAQLNALTSTETDTQKNAQKEIERDQTEIRKIQNEIDNIISGELTTASPQTLEGLYESDQQLSELMAKRADKSRINAIATKKIADASERYAATQKDYEKSMQDVQEEIGAANKRIGKIETDKSLNESEKRIAIAYEKQRIETLNARKNVIEGFFENMAEEGAALGRAKIDYSEDVKTTGEELKSLNQEINQRQQEIIKPILEDYEGRIIETRDQFISAVENNSPEEMIVQLRNQLLEMYDQYVAYGGTYKFSNADVDNKVGYIGNKTAIQYARDFEPSSVRERRAEIDKLRSQIQTNTSIVGKEKTSADESIVALSAELSTIEREMEQAAIDKTNRLIQLLIDEAETAGEKNAKKYANEAYDLKKGLHGGDKALNEAKTKMKELQTKKDEIQKSDKIDYGELSVVEREIERQKNIVKIFEQIENDRKKILEKIKNRGQEPKKFKITEIDFSDKTEEQIFDEIENLKQERDQLVADINIAKDSVTAIQDSKKSKESTYKSLRTDLRTKNKPDTEEENKIIDNVLSELDKDNIRGANKIIKQGGISDERLEIVKKMVDLKKQLLNEDKKIMEFQEIEKSANAELDTKLQDIKVRQDALRQRQAGQTKLRDEQVLKQHKESGNVEDERFEEERKDYDPWKSWRYAGMSEEEAVISERIRSLMYKAFTGAIEDAEAIELDTLKQKASEMGLELTDKGVKPKVEYADYMANPDKYLVPKITTEMAEKYGVSTRGTISGAVQAVSVTDPVNVGTVSNVASVNLVTIEALLSSIASKIGADTSGIPIGSTTTNAQPKFDYSGKTKSELNSILSSKNSTQDQIDSAALAALKMGKSLQLLDTGRYSVRNKSNGDIKTPEDYFKSRNINVKADNATVESGKQSGETKGTKTSGTEAKATKRDVGKLRNAYYNATSQSEMDEIIKEAFESGYGVTKTKDRDTYSISKKPNENSVKDFETYMQERADNTMSLAMKNLATEGNAKVRKAKTDDEKKEILKDYVSRGLRLYEQEYPETYKNGTPNKNAGKKKYILSGTGRINNGTDITDAFIKDNNIVVTVKSEPKTEAQKPKGEAEPKPKNEKQKGTQAKESSQKSEGQIKPTREGAKLLREAIQGATSQEDIDATIKKAFEGGYGVNKKTDGTYTVKKNVDKESVKDYETYLAEREKLDDAYFSKKQKKEKDSEPKSQQTEGKSKTAQAKESSEQKADQQVKPTRAGAERLRNAIQNATSQEAVDAVVKEAFEGGYGVNKKKDGIYTVKKKADKESVKDYETYLAERQKLDNEYFVKKLASEGNTKYIKAKTEAERKQILMDYVGKGLNLFEQEIPATNKNGKPNANAGQKKLVLAATKNIKGVDITDSFIKDNNITVKVEVEPKEKPDTKTESKTEPKSEAKPQSGESKKTAPKKTIAEQRGYKAYTEEDFKADENLVEQSKRMAKRWGSQTDENGNLTKMAQFWNESAEAAERYTQAAKKAGEATEEAGKKGNTAKNPYEVDFDAANQKLDAKLQKFGSKDRTTFKGNGTLGSTISNFNRTDEEYGEILQAYFEYAEDIGATIREIEAFDTKFPVILHGNLPKDSAFTRASGKEVTRDYIDSLINGGKKTETSVFEEIDFADMSTLTSEDTLKSEYERINTEKERIMELMKTADNQLKEQLTQYANKLNAQMGNIEQVLLDDYNTGYAPGAGWFELSTEESPNSSLSELVVSLANYDNKSSNRKEQVAFANSKTGFVSKIDTSKYNKSVSGKELFESLNTTVDTAIHSHPERLAAFSPGDIRAMASKMKIGIENAMVVAFDEIAKFDASKIKTDDWDLLYQSFLSELTQKSNEMLTMNANDFINGASNKKVSSMSDTIKTALSRVIDRFGKGNGYNEQAVNSLVNDLEEKAIEYFTLLDDEDIINPGDVTSQLLEVFEDDLKTKFGYNTQIKDAMHEYLYDGMRGMFGQVAKLSNSQYADQMQLLVRQVLQNTLSNMGYNPNDILQTMSIDAFVKKTSNETPVSTPSEEASEHNENAKSMEQEAQAAFDLKTAIEQLNNAYASGGKDAALSYLDTLNKDQMRQIAEEQGFTNQRGNLPKTGSLTRENWKGLLVGNIAGEIKKPQTAPDNTPSDIVDDIKNEEEVVTEATEATITLAEKINQLKEAASKKQDATELLKSIMDEHGKEGLEEALDELSNTQLKNVIEANGYADGKTIKGNKDQLRKRILGKFSDETVPVGATTGEINPTDDLHELLVAIQQETEARRENAEAKKEEAEASKSDDNEAQKTKEETNQVNEQAEAYDRLAEAKKKAQEMADAYDDPEKLQKDIDKKQKILDTRVKTPETKERYEAELEAMRKRLEVLKSDTGVKTDTGVEENTDNLKENKDAAEGAADAQKEFREKAEEPINDNSVEKETEDLKAAEEAAKAAAEAHEKYQKTVASLSLKDADDNFVKQEIKNVEDAQNMIRALLGDEKKAFGNAKDFRMKAGSNTFSYSDEIGNNYVYRYSKKEGHQLYETPELANQLTQLRQFENEVQRVMNMTSVKDVGGFMSSMFSEKDAEKVKRVQEIMENLSHMKEDIYAEDGFLKVDDDTLQNYKDELQELRDLVKQLHRQDVGEVINVGQSTGGLKTAKADLQAYFNTLDQGNASLVKFSNSNTEMVYTLRTADNMLETHTVSIDKYGQMMDRLSSSTKYLSPLQQLFSGVANKARELFNYFAASTSIYEVINILRKGVSIIKDFDDALTEMRKVSDESISSLKSFQAESFGIANSVGTTALQVQQSTADWMRLGETLDEAKESAKNATILLNVSEFSSIDDATQSLVSMSQAYKELDKIEIIDKLNNIGNNFSISTDQLATGLQNASAVLKTQGNDLDQAIALLTAGNAITQDVSKTSAGIRTIALRISGTEEAKNEIQDMGEDVDDFVVRTRSKTDQIIRDYTAVASNAYKGVSVLDANGNLRDTYDILLDIAKIYKEIQKEDKARGTNRAQALVETLAGKNRSNIAASILENPELLEEVYQSSLQSAGSALQENEKYLDSISGKLQLITNQMQEFATITINSDGIKAVLDIVNSLLSGVNSLAKGFGVVNTAIGAFVAFFMQKKGLGIFNYDKNTQQFGSGIPKIIDGIKKSFGRLEIEPEIVADFQKMDLSGNFFDQLMEVDGIKSDALFEFADGLDEVQQKSMTAGQAMMHFGTSVTSVGSVLGTIGQVALSTVSSILATVAVSAALGLAAKGIGWFWTNVVKAEETAIQKGNEAKQSIDEINKEYQDAEKQTKELGKRYNELRSGVLYKEGKGYTNNTLSADEFEEFLNVNQQIAALYPELRSGTDAQGRAYVDLGSDADTATSSLQKYLDIQRELANEKIGEKFGDQLEGVLANNNRINRDIQNDNYTIKSSSSNLQVAQEGLESLIQDIGNGNYQLTIKGGTDKNGELQDAIEQGFKDIGIDKQYGGNYYDENGLLVTDIMYYFKADTSELENAITETEKIVGKERDKYDEAGKASSNKALSERAIRDNWESLKPSLLASISSTKTYKDLSETYQNIVSEAIANMDLQKAYEKMPDNFEGGFEQFIKNQYLYTMSNIVLGDDGEIKEANAKLLDELLNFDSSEMTNQEYKDYVNNTLDDLTKDLEKPEEAKKQIKLILGFKIEDEDGESWDIDNRRNNLWEKLGGKIVEENGETKHKRGESVIKWSDFKNLTQSDYDALDYAVSNMNIDFEKELSKNAKQALDTFQKQYAKQKKYYDNQLITGNETDKEEAENWLTWYNNQIDKISKQGNPLETVLDIIERAKKELESTNKETKDGNLFDIFGDENYQANVENYKKNLSSLTSALETLRTEGKLTAEQMRDLQEQFPDLTDFSISGISKQASEELSNWISEFKDAWSDATPEGQKQMDTYIANMVASYRGIKITENDVRQSTVSSLMKQMGISGPEAADAAQAQYQTVMSALKKAYPDEELNMAIVLALQDQFSGDTDALIQKYDQYKLVWDLEVNLDEAQKSIDKLKSQRSTNEAMSGLKEAQGYGKTAIDYRNDNTISNALIGSYEEQIEIARQSIENNPEDELLVATANEKIAELQRAIIGELTTQENNNQAISNLPLDIIKQNRENISMEIDAIQDEISLGESQGKIDFSDQYSALIEATKRDNEQLETEETILEHRIEHLKKIKGDSIILNSLYNGLVSALSTNRKNQSTNASNIFGWQKKIDETSLVQHQQEAKLLSVNTQAAKNAISNAEAQGKEVTEAMYQAAIDASKAEQRNLLKQRGDLYRIQSELQAKIDSGEIDETNQDWIDNQEAIESNIQAFQDLQQNVEDYSHAITNIPKLKLEIEGDELERQLELTKQRIDSSTHRVTAGDYVEAMNDNAAVINNKKARIDFLQNNDWRRTIRDHTNQNYIDYQQELQGLQDELANAKEAQEEFNQALLKFPAEQIQKGIQKVETELQHLQEEQDFKINMGFTLTAEDYDEQIDKQKDILRRRENLDTNLNGIRNNLSPVLRAFGLGEWLDEQISANQTQMTQTKRNIFDLQKTKKYDLPIKEIQQDLDNAEIAGQRLKNTFDEIARSGRDVTAEDYAPMVDNLQEQIRLTEDLARSNRVASMDLSYGPELRLEYAQAAMQAENALASLTQQQYEYEEAIKQLPITELINQVGGYTDLQREASEVQQEITEAETKHTKVSDKLYQKLIDNGDGQIDNLKQQRKEWENLQNKVALGSSKWHEYQNEIDSIDDSISEMRQNQVGWFEQMTSAVSTNAAALSSAISSAFSEMNSETGISIDTMTELQKQFSDLAGRDVSNIFYQTADGMKMNVVAAENLIDAEYKLQTNNLYDAIEKQRDIIEKQGDATDENARKTVSAAEQKINAYQRELSMLQALYDQQKQQFTQYAAWQTAQQTDNAGKHYEDIQGYYKTAKEMYEKGLIGTDDFQEYVRYFDQWGQGTVESYERNKSKIERYLTEDITGVINFFDDLVSKGLATKDSEGIYDYTFSDLEDAADKMGMSTEWFRDMLNRSEDYGGVHDYVDNELEGRMKIQEATEKQIEAQLKYNQLVREGAPEDILEEAQDELDKWTDKIKNLGERTAEVTKHDGEISAKQIRDDVADINSLIENIPENASPEIMELFNDAIQNIAESDGIKIKWDAELNHFVIDEDAMQEAFPDYMTINLKPEWEDTGIKGRQKVLSQLTLEQHRLEELQKKTGIDYSNQTEFGNINVNERERLYWSRENVEKYRKAIESWGDNADEYLGSYSTVDGMSDFFDGVGEIAFTPMLQTEDGEVEYLDKDTVTSYINGIIEKADGDLSKENLLKLDAEGIESDGKTIKGLIADIGETAKYTGEAMHFLGKDGSITDLKNALADFDKAGHSEAVQKMQENWEGNEEAISGYLETLSNIDPEILKKIDLNDGTYNVIDGQDLTAYEQALDGLAKVFGLDAEEASNLVAILQQLNAFIGGGNGKYYQNESLGVGVSSLRDDLTTAFESDNIHHEVDLDFDATKMSLDEIGDKLNELKSLRRANVIRGFLGEDAQDELNTLIAALEKAQNYRNTIDSGLTDEEGTTYTADEFLTKDRATQEQIMAHIGIDSSEYDAFVQMVESQTIQAKITATMEREGMTAEELKGIESDSEFALKLGIDESQVEQYRQELENMTAEVPINVKIDETQFNALLNPEVNTDTATGQIQDLQTDIDNVKQKEPVVIEVKTGAAHANIKAIEGEINSLPDGHINISIDGTADVNGKLDILKSKIDSLTSTTHLIKMKEVKLATGTANPGGHMSEEHLGTAHFARGTTAFARGTYGSHDWTVGKDTDALVNEIGVESRVRDGRWEIIPGGPHVEKLKKDDIIYKCDFMQ